VFTQREQDDLGQNLKREWIRVEDELVLAVYGTLSWEVGFLGYRIVADLVGAALDRKLDWEHARYVVDRQRRRKSSSK
jgi:hypothetical protein